ncbi:2OG-Fe(II) oxygenase [Streptomyces sp. NPDC052721]|uniref:2OG-Fe(II) oxygenase n=1 Tax=Streptomyces sp. NPDC052721 TaxID=3154955 RepID=UPI003431BE9D
MIDLTALHHRLADPASNCRRTDPYEHYVWDGLFDPDALRAAARGYPDVGRMTQKPGIPRWFSLDLEPASPALRALCRTLLSAELAEHISAVTGTADLCTDPAGDWGSYRVSARGAVHTAHIGGNRHPVTGWLRRYSLFTYLNEGWQDDDGGLLELWRPGADGPSAQILPVFNRSVLIETTDRSLHGVSQVRGSRPRRMVTVHFWTKSPGPDGRELT